VYTPPGGSPRVNVFFSGFVTHEGQSDICWTQYNLSTMGPAGPTDNYAKLPFPTPTNYEELEPSGAHQLFSSRHLDWLVTGAAGAASASYTPAFRPAMGSTPEMASARRCSCSWRTMIRSGTDGRGRSRPSRSCGRTTGTTTTTGRAASTA